MLKSSTYVFKNVEQLDAVYISEDLEWLLTEKCKGWKHVLDKYTHDQEITQMSMLKNWIDRF